MPVKAGDILSLGRHTLQFVPTPMLHWPDNMVTYCPEEKILFSNDAFGQHYSSSRRYDDEVDMAEVMAEAEKYYANILMPYGMQMKKTIPVIEGLDISLIAPSHGVMWRSHIGDIVNAYKHFSDDTPDHKAVVVFDSMWHSTEKMARAVLEGFAMKGVPVKLYDLKVDHISDIMTDVLKAEYVAVGSPTINNQMLPTVASFLCYMKGLAPKNKKAFAFGSYGWGGQSAGLVNDGLEACKFQIVMEPVKVQYIPSEAFLKELSEKVAALD